MTIVLADHNLEGQAALLWTVLAAEGWLDLVSLQLQTFADVGLPVTASDRTVWRFVQSHEMLLLTNNRGMTGSDSLEQTLREELSPTSLPVLTIGNLDRIGERVYRERCARRLVEVVLDLQRNRGVGRLFIP